MGLKLSIVVSVYNIEEYIRECLSSLLEIDIVEKEIILVNDETPDNSIKVISDLIEKHPEVILINQKNGGLSNTRNVGLYNASGEYIYFIDGDDFIDPTLFRDLFINGYDNNAEVITGDFLYYHSSSDIRKNSFSLHQTVIGRGVDILVNYYNPYISPVVWRSIYKTGFLRRENILFTEGIYFEDVNWTPVVYFFSRKVYYSDVPFYYYRQRSGSIINSDFNEKKVNDSILLCGLMLQFAELHHLSVKEKNVFHHSGAYVLFKAIGKSEKALTNKQTEEINRLIPLLKVKHFPIRIVLFLYRNCKTLAFVLLRKKFR